MNLLESYRLMVKIRAFEEKLSELFSKGLLGGTSHFCIGQEASAVGISSAARPTDWFVSNHRCHGHLLARGLETERLLAELLGKVTGYCGGKGGSQHMCCMEKHFLGTNGIVGGGIPIATGAAFALKYKQSSDIAIVYFGDGASNQGTFHESLNIASLWKLPILFVCENNLYGMSTQTERTIAGKTHTVAPRAAVYDIPAQTIDGRDVETVFNTAKEAMERVRAGNGPELLELMTYRLCGHSKSEPRVYRTREEEAEMQSSDSILLLPKRLLELGFTQQQIDEAAQSAHDEVEAAAQKALAAPAGGQQFALSGVFAN
ncbi:MAG: thiamine pyrophosphate-dependent dehydrogenase E1 component subunit alpha [Victivallales bacterium]|nr:thiamine pyrophosphate-dependent dehydrogenase E1 component subunit alpha [Victivallales bacterium]